MAGNRFVFSGLDELRAELRAMPAELAHEAGEIVSTAAHEAAASVTAVYERHRVTGNLAKSVSVVTLTAGAFGTALVVKVSDPIAWLFDNGSQARHWVSGKSTGAMWGRTPPTHVFASTMARHRRAMYGALKDLIVTRGLTVSGEP